MKLLFEGVALTFAMLLLANSQLHATTFTLLYSLDAEAFDSPNQLYTNNDGAYPEANLLLVSNVLYGTLYNGGSNGYGTVFKANIDLSGFTVLHTFSTPNANSENIDGINPRSSLVVASNILYGTTASGGPGGFGTIFAVHTDGSGFTNIVSFTGSIYPIAISPESGLALSSNTLFGTTMEGGTNYTGSIFKVNTDGSGFTNFYSFHAWAYNSNLAYTNADGYEPYGQLVLSNNILYGTALFGGTNGSGTVFRINTDGTDFTNLYNFGPGAEGGLENFSNTDGANPWAGLLLVGDTLYGTTYDGGSNAVGTVFRINTDGSGFTNLVIFDKIIQGYGTNIKGGNPYSSLILSGSTLYGTTSLGGTNSAGTAFAVNTDGTDFTVIKNFGGGFYQTSATGVEVGFVMSGNTLYADSFGGGSGGEGTIFSLGLPVPIRLNTQMYGGKLVLSWSDTTFSLQSTPSFGTTFSNVLNATSPYTNTSNSTQQFFRLHSN